MSDVIIFTSSCNLLMNFLPMIKMFIFLTIKITPNGTSVYRKSTRTAQYVHLSSFTPWCRKIAWLRHLFIVLIISAVTKNSCLTNFLILSNSLLGMVSRNVLLRTFSNALLRLRKNLIMRVTTPLTCSPAH